MIEHDNIFYIRDLSEIGGVETFIWEMVKKYQQYDIAVVYKTANDKQLARLQKYCMCYKHTTQRIKCKIAIINWDTSIIDFIEDGADIYQTIHGDYSNPAYTWRPLTHPRIKDYICITKHILKTFKELMSVDNCILGYNPLTIDPEDKMIILVSATRLSPIKGKNRMIKLANALTNAGAEAISVNGQRIISTSEIRCAGTTIFINGERVGAPFIINAIGDPASLESGVTMRGGYVDGLKEWGLGVTITRETDVVIPKYNKTISSKFVTTVIEDNSITNIEKAE